MDYVDIYKNFDKYKKFAILGVIGIVVVFVIASDAGYYTKNNT
jgi:hypothetical protein